MSKSPELHIPAPPDALTRELAESGYCLARSYRHRDGCVRLFESKDGAKLLVMEGEHGPELFGPRVSSVEPEVIPWKAITGEEPMQPNFDDDEMFINYVNEVLSDPHLQAMVNNQDDARARPRTFEPTEAERLRFIEMSQNEYSRVMYGDNTDRS